MHGDFGAHARAQDGPVVGREADEHGDALDDLGEVARGVVGGQQGETRARAGRDAVDDAGETFAVVRVDFDVHRLPLVHVLELVLFEVRDDPAVIERDEGEQRAIG